VLFSSKFFKAIFSFLFIDADAHLATVDA